MKNIMVMLVAVGLVATTSADSTSFRWYGGPLRNNDGSLAVSGEYRILTFISHDAVIDFNPAISPQSSYGNDTLIYDMSTVGTPGLIQTSYMSIGGSVGQYAYAVAVEMNTANYTDWLSVPTDGSVTFDVGQMSPAITDADTNPPQDFDPGPMIMNNPVIPEPATIGLMGIAGMGLFLARRKSHR